MQTQGSRPEEKKVFARVRLYLLILTIVAPLFALLAFANQMRIDRILARGAVADATVTKAEITHGKSTRHYFDLVWRDRQGAQRKITGMEVSEEYYRRITGVSPAATVRVSYLADAGTSKLRTVVIDDPEYASYGWRLVWPWLLGFLASLAGTIWMRRSRRRRMRADGLIAV